MNSPSGSSQAHLSQKRTSIDVINNLSSPAGRSSTSGSPMSKLCDSMSTSPDLQGQLHQNKKQRSDYAYSRPDSDSNTRRFSNKSVSTGTDPNASPNRKDMSKEELSKKFEEWMRLIADNKINAKNSWDLALIDYFYEMSLVGEGESINFQRASCTLDGCVKIYTSRVDSVNSETRRLLDGLVGSYQAGQDKAYSDGANDDNVTDSPGRKGIKKKHARGHANTLEESLENLNVPNIDTELVQDPLFKKASADFDRSGAHALLLNTLCIDRGGKIMLDSSETTITYADSQPARYSMVDVESIIRFFADKLSDLEHIEVCPDIDFRSIMPSDNQEIVPNIWPVTSDLTSQMDVENYSNEQTHAIITDDCAETPKLSYDPYALTPVIDVNPKISNQYPNDVEGDNNNHISDNLEFFLEKQPELNEDEFSYFDNTLAYMKDTAEKEKKSPKQKKISSKSPLKINFSQEPHLSFRDVIKVSKKPAQLLMQTQPNVNTSIVTCKPRKKELLKLFLKPDDNLSIKNKNSPSDKLNHSNTITIIPGQKNYVLDVSPSHQDNFPNQPNNPQEYEYHDSQPLVVVDDIYESKFNVCVDTPINKSEPEISLPEDETQYNSIFIRATSNNNNISDKNNNSTSFGSRILNIISDRTFSRIDSRGLKKNLWKVLSTTQDANLSSEDINSFSKIYSSLKDMYPEKKRKDITPAQSFVCLLDLAKEKNLIIIPKYTDSEHCVLTDLEISQRSDV